MEQIWVVESQCNDGNWYASTDFGSTILAFNNFYAAHRAKRDFYKRLKSIAPKIWSKKRFRVRKWNAPIEQKES